MRMRSIPYFAMALVSWTLVWKFLEKVKQTGFDYELGSSAFPVPPYIKLLALGVLSQPLRECLCS
jgi:hypothetical protein